MHVFSLTYLLTHYTPRIPVPRMRMHMHMHMHTQGTRVRNNGPHQLTLVPVPPIHPESPLLCCAVLCCACWSCRHTVLIMPGYTYLGTYFPKSESESASEAKLSPSSTAQRGRLWIAAAA
jgi:hypothetical protein